MSASSRPVVVLAGGTGGAKLARGMLDVTGPDELIVVANTGDDIEIHGAHVSPDPDLVSFWLADRIDARGWGLDGDTFQVMGGLRELGVDVWFELGDRDLAYVLEAIARARAVVIGPSNPVISIGPILALPGLREALATTPAPVVAVSPIVGGEVLKGPTAAFLRGAGRPVSSAGIADSYAGLLDGLVADERTDGLPVLETDILMDTPQARARIARETLDFALALT